MRLTALIHGTVQGVGYRRWVQRRARDMGLAGSVENVEGGRVEVVAEGPEPDLQRLLHWLRRGPPHASVSRIEEQWSEDSGLRDFHIY